MGQEPPRLKASNRRRRSKCTAIDATMQGTPSLLLTTFKQRCSAQPSQTVDAGNAVNVRAAFCLCTTTSQEPTVLKGQVDCTGKGFSSGLTVLHSGGRVTPEAYSHTAVEEGRHGETLHQRHEA